MRDITAACCGGDQYLLWGGLLTGSFQSGRGHNGRSVWRRRNRLHKTNFRDELLRRKLPGKSAPVILSQT